MKIILTVLCMVAFVTLANTSSASWGYRNNSDFRLLRDTVVRFAKKNNYLDVSVIFPKSGQGNTNTIKYMSAIDNFRNNSGAHPTVVSGGIGYRSVTIRLSSQYSQGINSTLEIYGR